MKKAGRIIFCTMVMLVFFWLFPSLHAWGEEAEEGGGKEIEITSDVMFSGDEDYEPYGVYEDEDGKMYRLKSWHTEPAVLGARVREVKQEITYESIEDVDMIPETAALTERDEQTGQTVTGNYPVLGMKTGHERWTDDFTFPVVFHSYGASFYQLGETRISCDEQRPQLEGCEAALLEMIGVNQDSYRVTNLEWEGNPYLDEDGVLCRDAVASGEKKVKDYVVSYGGRMVFPEVEGFRCVSVYGGLDVQMKEAQDVVVLSESVPLPDVEQTSNWLIIRKGIVITMAIAGMVLLLAAIVWIVKYLIKKRKGEEEMETDGACIEKRGKNKGKVAAMILLMFVAAVLISIMASGQAGAATGWQIMGNGQWKYVEEESRKEVKDGWKWIQDGWYHFDSAGCMETGWICLEGQWYFLNPVSDGGKGRMLTGWQWIDGYCYYLETESDGRYSQGRMYASELTPDGYGVNADGAWTADDGTAVYAAGKGIRSAAEQTGVGNVKNGKSGGGSGSGGGGGNIVNSENPDEESGDEETLPGNQGEMETVTEYSYSVHYADMDDCTIFKVMAGRGEADSVIVVDAAKIEGYEICEGQKMEFLLSSDSMVIFIYYRKLSPATPSEAKKVKWSVYFVQEDDYSNQIFRAQTGNGEEGTELIIDFPELLVGVDGYQYRSLKPSPCRLVIAGEGQQKYYVEFKRMGKIPDVDDDDEQGMEKRNQWLEIAGAADESITGIRPSQQQLISDGPQESTARLINLISMVKDEERYQVYLIGRNHVPSSFAAGKVFADVKGLSEVVMDAFTAEGDTYNVVRVGFNRTFDSAVCRHDWVETDQVFAGCTSSGHETVTCKKCGKEETVIWPATGHFDEDGDGRCDVCEKPVSEEDSGEEDHYRIGDVRAEIIGGRKYLFRCIDDDYFDGKDNSQSSALFLCDSIIRSDVGSSAESFEKMRFGSDNNYKHSDVRKWLNKNWMDEPLSGHMSYVGVNTAFEGSTEQGDFAQFDAQRLKSFEKPFQLMEDKIFILSVEEAVRYRDYLWRFEGSEEDNPQSQVSAYSKGYYLRNPQYDGADGVFRYGRGIYAVDVLEGNIRPVDVGDTSIGIRPVMTLIQS